MSKICTEYDDFISNQDTTIWICELDNGLVVYQDDGRPEYSEASAWIRLKEYCYTNDINITGMKFKFRSHVENIQAEDKCDGWFFCKSALGHLYSTKTKSMYTGGYVRNGKIYTTAWTTPELLEFESDVRDLEDDYPCLILNTNLRQLERSVHQHNT